MCFFNLDLCGCFVRFVGGGLGAWQRDVAGAPEVSRLAACTASPQPSPTRQLDYCASREAGTIASLRAHRSIGPVDARIDATTRYKSNHRRPWKDAALLRCLGSPANVFQLPNAGTTRYHQNPDLQRTQDAILICYYLGSKLVRSFAAVSRL